MKRGRRVEESGKRNEKEGGSDREEEEERDGWEERRKKETRYARDERTGEWINRSRMDGWVSTSRDGGDDRE